MSVPEHSLWPGVIGNLSDHVRASCSGIRMGSGSSSGVGMCCHRATHGCRLGKARGQDLWPVSLPSSCWCWCQPSAPPSAAFSSSLVSRFSCHNSRWPSSPLMTQLQTTFPAAPPSPPAHLVACLMFTGHCTGGGGSKVTETLGPRSCLLSSGD